MAAEQGAAIVPVWNKSNREHTIVGSEPASVRAAADAAVRDLGWTQPYHVDADHIRLDTVDRFLAASDFFTIDVADCHRQAAPPPARVDAFVDRHPELIGRIEIPGIDEPFTTTARIVAQIAGKYLFAVQEAGEIYRHIAARKGAGNFITEVSMDETDAPQTPPELLRDPRGHRRREDSGPDHRAQVHRPLQQGRRLRRRRRPVREGVQRGPRGDRLRGQAVRPARQPEAERALGQRQVLASTRRSAAPSRSSTPACTSRPPARRGSKS